MLKRWWPVTPIFMVIVVMLQTNAALVFSASPSIGAPDRLGRPRITEDLTGWSAYRDAVVDVDSTATDTSSESERAEANTPALPVKKPSRNLLVNADFEKGTTRWEGYGVVTLTADSTHHVDGSSGLRISDRAADWSAAFQNITGALKAYGPGRYQVSVKAKTAAGRASPFIRIELYDSARHDLTTLPTTIDDDSFVTIEGILEVTWVGRLNRALISLSTGRSGTEFLGGLYIDDFRMVKLDQTKPVHTSMNRENLALGARVTASSALSGARHLPTNVVNGNEDTRSEDYWASDVSEGPQWIQLDFGRSISFNRVEMFLRASSPQKSYEMQYRDSERWVRVIANRENTEARNTHVFDTVTASEIRVEVAEGTARPDGQGENIARIVQIQIYNDENLALNATVMASSTEDQPNHSPEDIVDGDDNTSNWNHWASDVADGPQWVQLEFGRAVTFRRVEFYTRAGYEQTEYEIQYWNGSQWVGCAPKVSGNRADHNSHSFPAVTAERLRVYVTAGNVRQHGQDGAENIARISEVKVFSSAGVYSEIADYPSPIPQSITQRPPRSVVGAIRWDGWGSTGNPSDPGSITERTLSPRKYHHRLPWYARVTGKDSVTIPRYSQAIVDREILYARAAGIDYWAFVMYESPSGIDAARNLYLRSKHKEEVRWAAILGASGFSVTSYPWLVAQFKTTNYQKVLNGRPLVFVRVADVRGKPIVEEIRAEAKKQSAAEPYIVIMDAGVRVMRMLQGDAVTAYAGFGGNGQPYRGLAAADAGSWQGWAEKGAQVVPIVTSGWDPRPRVDTPNPWSRHYGAKTWAQAPTPEELANHMKGAMEWIDVNPGSTLANAVLTYAWNEGDEGGWLIPTLGENGRPDTRRLDAIQRVLRPTSRKIPAPAREAMSCGPRPRLPECAGVGAGIARGGCWAPPSASAPYASARAGATQSVDCEHTSGSEAWTGPGRDCATVGMKSGGEPRMELSYQLSAVQPRLAGSGQCVGQHDGSGRSGRRAGRVKQVRFGLEAPHTPQSVADAFGLWMGPASSGRRLDRER